MNIFDDLLGMAEETLDLVNGEPVVIHPQYRGPNGRAVPDPERRPVHLSGIFEIRPGPGDIQLGNRNSARGGNDLRLLQNGATNTLSIRATDLDGLELRQGDRIDLPDRGTGRRFEVVACQPDEHGRLKLQLVEK
ncbi:hypothetical protein [Aureimonas sp. AU20]|uniref:head-tail joining protein n=1 Tax=Aureimonas sp. AU20 TaxID=1349819 RepID=UPI00072090C5|nr:hypothetical protein [Aureimonas sp. AU20]ALN73190.1 hypothetical protein M673_10695 [Aureimonas sp. AU20]